MSNEPASSDNRNGSIGGVARAVIGTMKRDPLLLGFMIVVLVLLWFIKEATEARRKMDYDMMQNILAACLPAMKKEH